MVVEVEADNAQQAEEMVRQANKKEEYVLDTYHFSGVEFFVRRSRNQKHRDNER